MTQEWREHSNSAFDHTMDVIDRCANKGYSYETFVACLCHDFGKATTPKEILPGHAGHEHRSKGIAELWLKEHRFTRKINELVPVACTEHMKAHNLNILKPTTLIRWYKAIRRHIPEIIEVFDCDHELNVEQRDVLRRLEIAFKTAKIEVTKEIRAKGIDAIKHYVEQQYVRAYKEAK